MPTKEELLLLSKLLNNADNDPVDQDTEEQSAKSDKENSDFWSNYYLEFDIFDHVDTTISALEYPVDLAKLEIELTMRKGIVIDEVTMADLKLLDLVEAIDQTQTNVGHRMLEYLVHFPLRDIEEINKRAAAIRELAETPQLIAVLSQCFSIMAKKESSFVNYCFPQEGKWLPSLNQDMFQSARTYLSMVPLVLALIKQTKSDRLQEVCANLEHLLRKDKVKRLYEIVIEGVIDGSDADIMDLHPETWSESLSAQVIHELSVYAPILSALSDTHIRVDLTTGKFKLTPRKDGEAINIHYPTNISLNLEKVREHYFEQNAIFNLYYLMGVIEAYCSLAGLEKRLTPVNTLFPSFRKTEKYEVKLDKPCDPNLLLRQGKFIPNDYVIDAQTRGFVITGPNTGGKTVYGFTLPILQVLAQAGAPIPAEFGDMSAADYIFTLRPASKERIGEGRYLHSLVRGREMLERVTPNSLVAIDDFEGTDPEDCYRESLIMMKELLRVGCGILLTTQDSKVALEVQENNEGRYNGLAPVQLQCDITQDGAKFYYKVIPGIGKSIGEVCAKFAGMNEESLDALMERRGF